MPVKHFRAVAAATAAALAAPANADYMIDILPPATPVAQQIYDLHFGILWVCVGIFIVVFGAMFWSVFAHRKARGAQAAQFHENTTIEVIWTIVPFIILIGMAYPATRTVLDMKDGSNPDISVKVTAYQWKWEYDYQQDGVRFFANLSTPHDQIEEHEKPGPKKNPNYLLEVDNPMVVPVGKKVRLLITSNDVIHGWYVPQLGVNQYGIPGFVKDAWFKVDKPGRYLGQCSQICGKEHGYMPIVVDAVSAEDYAKWVTATKAKMPKEEPVQVAAAAPAAAAAEDPNKKWTADELRAQGEKVYAANCSACHQATGKGTPPAFPPLDGSKVVQGPKPAQIATVLKGKAGTAMASFAHLSDADLASVITYTRTSWSNKSGEVMPAEVKAARK